MNRQHRRIGWAAGAVVAALVFAGDAAANDHWRRVDRRAYETILVEPTTYAVPTGFVVTESAFVDQRPVGLIPGAPRSSAWGRFWFPTRYYAVDSSPAVFAAPAALPTRFVESSFATFDFPVVETSDRASICCESGPRSARREVADESEPPCDVETTTPTDPSAETRILKPTETRASRAPAPRTIESTPIVVPAPRAPKKQATDSGPATREIPGEVPDRTPVRILESEPTPADPPLPETAEPRSSRDTAAPTDKPVVEPAPAPGAAATPPPAPEAAPKAESPIIDPPGGDAGAPRPPEAGKTDPATKPAGGVKDQPGEWNNVDVEPIATLRRSALKPTSDALGGVVSGRVILAADRAPEPGASVVWTDPARKLANRIAASDALGRFALYVPEGIWELHLVAPDGERLYYGNFTMSEAGTLRGSDGRAHVSLTLKR